ncbi:tripartite tricarboxylate transporter TctB family protein [Pseudonocardia sichuanensis]|uniref:Putative tricarboxylic transport membrane protein n=1 Tax=Pseudonocardia kunmingensis TaxID=630975 RepID=A0A543DI10_9PSEU|nr:tripartite tricarboxylate transporter TctB family protein [Pseudonocardia kunmingensis]TQM08953.1 putative tricarboxylic transport membrane protein [Pseudonocardia kunmingensis]
MARPATTDDKINLAVAVLTVAVAAVFWSQRSYTTQHGGTFADPVIIVLGVLGLVLLVLGLLRRPVGRDSEVEERLPVRGLVLAVALLAAWVAALPYLGYLVGGIVFFVLMAVLMRTERPTPRAVLLDVVVAVVVVTAFYLTFTEVLYVRLPELEF